MYIIYISEGSVAKRFMCGGTFNDDLTTNLLLNLPVKNFENRTIFGKVMSKRMVS